MSSKRLVLRWKAPRWGDAEPFVEFVVAKREHDVLVGTQVNGAILRAYPMMNDELRKLASMLLEAAE